MKQYNYVYITSNLINGKQYVGDHSTNNIDDGYLGSGDILKKAIKKYNPENFKKDILENFKTKEEAFNSQKKYINRNNTLQPNGYNISPTGGHNVKGCMSEETKIKIGLSNKGKKSWLGKKHTEKSKEKIGKATSLRIPWNKGLKMDPSFGKKLSEKLKGNIPWNKGIKLSEKIKEKMKKPKSEEHKEKLRKPKSKKGRNNIKKAHSSKEYKLKMSSILKGRKFSEETKKKMSLAAKKRWENN